MGVISTIIGGIGGFFEKRGQRKLEEKKLEIEAVKQGMEANRETWKDEYLTVVITLPVILLFTAVVMGWVQTQGRIYEAFEAMDKLPDWYQEIFTVTVYAGLGVLGVIRPGLKLLDRRGRRKNGNQ